jgi:uncharacterized membrane protein YeiH
MISDTILLDTADFIGIVSFALSGFYIATEDRLDILGIFIASFLTALGGGVMRDIIADRIPFSFFEKSPPIIVISVLFFAILFDLFKQGKSINRQLLILSDSIGLISFSISGALVGLHVGFSMFGVSLLAIITATGGGVMRDILLNRIPLLLTSELYGTISLLVGIILFILSSYSLVNLYSISAVFTLGLLFRLLAYYQKWHLPQLGN